MSGDPLRDDFDTLFHTPIETLALSQSALRILKWYHFASVGDCLLFYVLDARGDARLPLKLNTLLYGEVFEWLVAEDYWRILESAGMWQHIGRKREFSGPSLTWWEGEEQNLYRVSIDALELPPDTCTLLQRHGMPTIGDCIDYYWHMALSTPFRYREDRYHEIRDRLITLDCWEFIAEQFDD